VKIGYARVSTDDQNVAMQLEALAAAGCEKVFADKLSGARARPQLTRCLASLLAGDVLTVWRLDRLGRSLTHLVYVVEDLYARDVGFHSLTEAINTATPHGKLMFHLMAALAEFERALLRERTTAGIESARRRGVAFGRPRSLSAEQVEHAHQLARAGRTVIEIAALLGVSKDTVYRAGASPRLLRESE
jgi:DNA invertase Pin-like site-specific DNA recombinase